MFFIPNVSIPKILTYITAVEGTAASITIPALSKEGDLAILCDTPRNNPATDPGITIPSGWTQLGTYYNSGTRMIVSYKKLSASDPNTSVTGGSGNLNQRKTMGIFRPSRIITSVAVASVVENFSTGDLAAQSVLADDMILPSIALCHTRGDGSYSSTAGSSPTANNVSVSGFQELLYNIYNFSKTDQIFNMPDSGTVNFCQTMAINVSMN